jgi:hypothetical protein
MNIDGSSSSVRECTDGGRGEIDGAIVQIELRGALDKRVLYW